MIGKNIKRLRVNAGITQEQLADCFGVTIDELMDYKLRILTYKERFVKFMVDNGVLNFKDAQLKSGAQVHFYINSENFTTNVQIAAVVVIANRMVQQDTDGLTGFRLIEEKYHTKLYSVITEEDIDHAIQNQIV